MDTSAPKVKAYQPPKLRLLSPDDPLVRQAYPCRPVPVAAAVGWGNASPVEALTKRRSKPDLATGRGQG